MNWTRARFANAVFCEMNHRWYMEPWNPAGIHPLRAGPGVLAQFPFNVTLNLFQGPKTKEIRCRNKFGMTKWTRLSQYRAGIPLDKMVLPEVILTLGIVPVIEYGETGTDDLYRSLSEYVRDYDAFLLANHGVLTLGRTVLESYHRMETVEHAAMIQFIASQLGRVNVLSKGQVKSLIDQREKWGIRKDVGIKKPKRKK